MRRTEGRREDYNTNIPSFTENYAEEENDEQCAGTDPAVGCKRSRPIEICLVLLRTEVRLVFEVFK